MERLVASMLRVQTAIAVVLAASLGGMWLDVATAAAANVTVTMGVSSISALDASACAGSDLDLGTIIGGGTSVASSSCTLTWGSNNDSSTLRVYQSDGVGTAMASGANTIADFQAGVADWSAGTSTFGACLEGASGTGVTTNWPIDDGGGCTATNGDPWRSLPVNSASAGSRIAGTTTATATATAALRFGVRVPSSQNGGTYAAAIVFEVIAPGVGNGAPYSPTLVTPASAATVGTNPTLTATYLDPDPTDTGQLAFQVCPDSACATVTHSGTAGGIAVNANGSWNTPALAGGSTWWWRARATDAAAVVGSWSATQSFTVSGSPTLVDSTPPTVQSTGCSPTIAKPDGVVSGHMLIAIISLDRDWSGVVNDPDGAGGWTLIRATYNGTSSGLSSWYKIATGSEPASYTFTVTGGTCLAQAGILAFSGASVVDVDSGAIGANNPMTAASVTTTVAGAVLIACFATDESGTASTPTGMTEYWDLGNGSNKPANSCSVQTLGAAGATGSRASTSSTSTMDWAAQLIAIRP